MIRWVPEARGPALTTLPSTADELAGNRHRIRLTEVLVAVNRTYQLGWDYTALINCCRDIGSRLVLTQGHPNQTLRDLGYKGSEALDRDGLRNLYSHLDATAPR